MDKELKLNNQARNAIRAYNNWLKKQDIREKNLTIPDVITAQFESLPKDQMLCCILHYGVIMKYTMMAGKYEFTSDMYRQILEDLGLVGKEDYKIDLRKKDKGGDNNGV